MSRSAAKRTPWLADQISTARRNLSEWPNWMKEASKFERRQDAPITPQTQRTRKSK
jgi:hypothetical protein